MDPDGLTTDQLRRWAEGMSTVGLQQLIQICREELQQRSQNNPRAWNSPSQVLPLKGSSSTSGNAASGAPPPSQAVREPPWTHVMMQDGAELELELCQGSLR